MIDDVKIEVGPTDNSPTIWKSMCITADKSAIQYFTTISIITGIMGFCIYKLSTDESCAGQPAYGSFNNDDWIGSPSSAI